MKDKPRYKMTPLGWLPEEWEIKKVAQLAKVTAGATPSTNISEYWNGEIRWMNSGELNNKQIYEVSGRITEKGLSSSSTKLLPPNCVLIGLAGQGKTRGTVAMNKVELCTNQSIAAIIPNGKFIEDYLYYNFENRYEELRKLSTGDGGRGGLNLGLIGALYVPLPPFPEQKAIAKVLSTWDKAIERTQDLIKQKELRKKYLMQQLLTGKKRLKGFSGEWTEIQITSYFEFIKSYSVPRDGLITDDNTETPYCIHYGDIHAMYEDDFLDFEAQKNIPRLGDKGFTIDPTNYLMEGDIIMADASEDYDGVGESVVVVNIGKNAAVGGLHTIVLRDRSNGMDKHFSGYLFASESVRNMLRKKATGTSVYSVSRASLSTLTLLLPSSIEEQTAIAKILKKSDDEITILRQHLIALQSQKKGLMQVLLSGKRRIKYECD